MPFISSTLFSFFPSAFSFTSLIDVFSQNSIPLTGWVQMLMLIFFLKKSFNLPWINNTKCTIATITCIINWIIPRGSFLYKLVTEIDSTLRHASWVTVKTGKEKQLSWGENQRCLVCFFLISSFHQRRGRAITQNSIFSNRCWNLIHLKDSMLSSFPPKNRFE